MIKVSLYRDSFENMAHDKSLQDFYPANNTEYQSKMSREAFDEFLKANNLVPYKNHLKSYQEGTICGEFSEL